MKLAEKLSRVMSEKGISAADIERRTGISRGTVHHYLHGDYSPKNDKLEKLAAALGVSVSYLAGYTDDPNPTGDPGLDSFLDSFTRMTQPGSFGSVSVSRDEYDLILAFREADPAIQSAVRKLLDLGGDR